jgi:hypothetical protein
VRCRARGLPELVPRQHPFCVQWLQQVFHVSGGVVLGRKYLGLHRPASVVLPLLLLAHWAGRE